MPSSQLLTFYRSIKRSPLQVALNVLGLSLGVAVFLVLSLLVLFETSFDRWIPGSDSIYRLTATYTFPERAPERHGYTSGMILPLMEAEYPEVDDGVRVVAKRHPVGVGVSKVNEDVAYADPSFFRIMDLPFLAGDDGSALSSPTGVVLTESAARRHFGATNVLGRTIELYREGKTQIYQVSGVLRDLPPNTHLKFDLLAQLSPEVKAENRGLEQWGAPTSYTYVRIPRKVDAEAVSADLEAFVGRHSSPNDLPQVGLTLDPINSLHFSDVDVRFTAKPGVDARLVYCLAAVALLTLLIAVLNYINLATARSALRAREIALRKVLGGTRGSIVVSLLSEALLVAVVAGLLGLLLAQLALPFVNRILGSELSFSYWGRGGVFPSVLGISLLVGLAAGLYPALSLSRVQPAAVFAAGRTSGGGRWEARLRSVLSSAQFVVTIAFIICTLVIAAQSAFLRDADRGFRREGLILITSLQSEDLQQRQESLLQRLRSVPGVVSVTASIREPGLPNEALKQVSRPGQGLEGAMVGWDVVGRDYFETYDVALLAGRGFSSARQLDDTAGVDGPLLQSRGFNVVVNERAADLLGFGAVQEAVGKSLLIDGGTASIVGVVRDVHFGSPQAPTAPVIYQLNTREVPSATAAVRYEDVRLDEMMSRLRAVWRTAAPEFPFEAKTADTGLSAYYVPDQQRAALFGIGCVLAVVISCLGLYGLAAFNTTRRFKEVGIRKTLGASTEDVMALLLMQTLRPVFLASLIAWPLAFILMAYWLNGFDQRISISPLYFVGASFLVIFVATLTVALESLRLARSKPADALRYE